MCLKEVCEMKFKTLAWLQIVISSLLILGIVYKFASSDLSVGWGEPLGAVFGANIEVLLLALLFLLTGRYNLSQKK